MQLLNGVARMPVAAFRSALNGYRGAGAKPDARVVELSQFGDDADRLWERVGRASGIAVVRDRRYLNWRFFSRPDASYQVLAAVGPAGLSGYMVFRIADTEEGRLGFIVDFLVEEVSLFTLLISAAEPRMRDQRVNAIICSVCTPPFDAVLREHGYFAATHRLPARLESIVHSRDSKWLAFADVARWYLTMGDGDFEMAF